MKQKHQAHQPATISSQDGHSSHECENDNRIYTCPMHPEVKSNKPGKCPKCGMDLVAKESTDSAKSSEPTYTCRMHPEVKCNKLGKCPKCEMDLVLKKNSLWRGCKCRVYFTV